MRLIGGETIHTKHRVLLLVLLSLISVFFAEVISGSMPFPLFEIWGYIVVIPLYGLHVIILLYIIRNFATNKKILFSTLYFGGVIFGLYEAYITKVLWEGLTADALILFNVAILDYIVLVFFWHPIFSFIIPVLVFERLVTSSDYVYQGLPTFIKRFLKTKYGVFILMVIIGFFSAFNGLIETLTASEVSILAPIFLIFFWVYKKGILRVYTLDEILPTKKGMIYCSIYLFLIYFSLGIFFKPEFLTMDNHISIWVSYVLFGYLFYRKLKANQSIEVSETQGSIVAFKSVIFYTLTLMISGIVFVAVFSLFNLKDIIVITTWIIWMVIGFAMLLYSLIH